MSKAASAKDIGLTHVALPATNLEASVAFYFKYAKMQVVHRRQEASRIIVPGAAAVGGKIKLS